MVQITQSEANFIRENSPATHIQMTSKRKKGNGKDHGKGYFMTEDKAAMELLKEYRDNPEKFKIKKDDNN